MFPRCSRCSYPIILFLFILLAGFSPFAVYADETPSEKPVVEVRSENAPAQKKAEAIADELIIKYKDDTNFLEKRQFKQENDLEKPRINRDSLKKENIEKVKLEDQATADEIEEIIDELEGDARVEYAEPNYLMEIQAVTPDDAEYSRQWALPRIHAPEAWESGTGDSGVIIAVLDTGLDFSHPDAPKYTVLGYDFINDDNDPSDDHGHGTFIAGVIAANSNNSEGIAGICWDCSIMPVKVMDSRGIGTYADVANGIVWAADHGADIINLSIGGYGYSQTLLDAVTYAQEKGVLIIAAGGNQAVSDPLYPAAYPDVIGVTATDESDQVWSRANSGDYIDLAAPGVDVFGLSLNNRYRPQTGSSVAAAHVSGAAALLLSQKPASTAGQLALKMYDMAEELGDGGRDNYYGFGRLNASVVKNASGEEITTNNGEEETEQEGSESENGGDNTDEEDALSGDSPATDHDIGVDDEQTNNDDDTNNNENESNTNNFQNLTVIGIEIDPLVFKIGEHANIIIHVQNQGDTEKKNVNIETFINDSLVSFKETIAFIPPEAIQSVQFPWQPISDAKQKTGFIIKAQVSQAAGEILLDDNVLMVDLLVNNEDGVVTIQYATYVHQYLTEQAISYLESGGINSQANEEMKDYISEFRQGATDEDATGCFGEPIDVLWRPLRHFYRPTDKKGYFDSLPFNTPVYNPDRAVNPCFIRITPNQHYPNAYEWAKDASRGNRQNFAKAIEEYNKNNKAEAYRILGHILHLIEDMSLPEHTQLESHADVVLALDEELGSGYEQYISDLYNDDEAKLESLLNSSRHSTYYNEMISNFDDLEDYFDSMASLSYYRNRFQGDLSKPEGQRGQLEDMFPNLTLLDSDTNRWLIPNVGSWYDEQDDEVTLDDMWWETTQFDGNPDDSGWYYIENSYKQFDFPEARPAQYEADWYSYALAEMKKPRSQRFKTPYSGAYTDNNQFSGKILAEVFAEDLVPLAVQHAAGVMDLFWRETHPGEQAPREVPELSFANANQVQFREQRKTLYYEYDVAAQVQNTGTGQATEVSVCFTPEGENACIAIGSVGNVAPGEVKPVSFTVRRGLFGRLSGAYIGTLKIVKSPGETNVSDNIYHVPGSAIQPFFRPSNPPSGGGGGNGGDDGDDGGDDEGNEDEEAGGVDLSFAELGGIQLDPVSSQIRFVIRGEEAQAGEPVIDLADESADMTKVFLQALAVPNSKHYISLDLIPEGNGRKGKARVPSPFERTDVADAFLKADVAMKFDLFSAGNIFDSFTAWTNLVKASPYWAEISSKGFQEHPDWTIAATIIPGEINARQTDNNFFLEDITLSIDAGWWILEPTINLNGYSLSSAAQNDILQRLAAFRTDFENSVKDRALTVTLPKLNSTNPGIDPRFRELRSIYAAVAAAQWYKQQVRQNHNLPYADLVDSENLAGIEMNHPFDWSYWDGQAYQNLGSFPCQALYGSVTCWQRGGASLESSQPEISGDLTAEQDNILDTTINQLGTAESGGNQYVYGGNISAPRADLEIGEVSVNENRVLKSGTVTITVPVMNSGPLAAPDFDLKLSDEVTFPDGSNAVYPIADFTVAGLEAWAGTEQSVEWILPDVVGTHVVRATVDTTNAIKEMSEGNNSSQVVAETVDPAPVITLVSPDLGAVYHPDDIIFEAAAWDALTGAVEENSRYSWESSLDGNLGSGTTLTTDLSVGNHVITLTVEGPHGISDSKVFNLYVRPLGSPLPRIGFPIDGAHFSQELTYTFVGSAEDNEDGRLSGANLLWNSSIDGELGSGEEITAQLSLGEHEISFSATDSDGQESTARVSVTVEVGTPTLAVTSPNEGAKIIEGQEIDFAGSASDIQEGDISLRIIWSSDLDGVLEQANVFARVLSAGEHLITATVTDRDGLSVAVRRTITVENTPPEVQITAPVNGSRVDFGAEVTFQGSASDLQDGALAGEFLAWTSDRDGWLGNGESFTLSTLSPGWHTITLTAADSGGETGTATVNVNIYAGIPTINILRPAGGQTFTSGSEVILEAAANDDQDGALGGENVVWTSNSDGVLGTGTLLELNNLSVGAHTIRVEATDSDNWKAFAITEITIQPRQAPQASILFPREGASFPLWQKIYFYGNAGDPEDGDLLAENLTWTSGLDGALGHGLNVSADVLNVGSHVITFTATDSDGMSATGTVNITITPLPPVISINSPADGAVIHVGEEITFAGIGADSLTWTSSADGELGTGGSLSTNTLKAGSHLITLDGTDANGLSGQAQITVIVADESSLVLNKFSDGSAMKLFDFQAAKDYTTGIALPKEAAVDNAQMTMHPQRGMEEMDTQFEIMPMTLEVLAEMDGEGEEAEEEVAEETEEVELAGEATEEIAENRVGQEEVEKETISDESVESSAFQVAPAAIGVVPFDSNSENYQKIEEGNYFLDDSNSIKSFPAIIEGLDPPEKEGDLSVMDGNGSAQNYGMGFVTNGNLVLEYPRRTDFNVGDIVGNAAFVGYNSVPIDYSWVFVSPDSFGHGVCGRRLDPVPDGLSLQLCAIGPLMPGKWDVYFWSGGTVQYIDHFNLHEQLSQAPEVNVEVHGDIMEGTTTDLVLNMRDNGSLVQYTFYWNDGSGWQSTVHSPLYPYFFPGQFFRMASPAIGPFPERTTVQYYGTATDFEGNVGQSDTQSFTVQDSDVLPPSIANITIEEDIGADGDSIIDETEPFRMHWRVTDATGIGEVTLHIDGEPVSFETDGGNYLVHFDPRVPGVYSYSITATDSDNSPETATATGTFEIMRRPLLFNPSMDAGADGAKEWEFSGEMTEDQVTSNFADSLNAYIQANSPDATGKVEIPLAFHADSGFVLRANNLNVAYRIVDTTPPTISDVTLNPESPAVGQMVSVSVTAVDNTEVTEVRAGFGEERTLLVAGDGDTFTGSSFTAPGAGVHDFTVVATDASGLTSALVVPVRVIFTGPELSVDSVIFEPANPLLTGQTVEATVTVRNTGNQPANTEVFLNHVSEETLGVNVPAESTADMITSFTLPTPGNYDFIVSADPSNSLSESDETNNTFTYSYTTTDGTPPVFDSLNFPAEVRAGRNFTATATVSDNAAVERVWVRFNGQDYAFSATDGTYTAELTAPTALGQMIITFTAEDSSGLTAVLQRQITVIDARPNLAIQNQEILSPAEGNVFALDRPYFVVKFSNDDDLSAGITIRIEADGEEFSVTNEHQPIDGTADLFHFSWNGWQATAGTHRITMTLDPENAIDERDETDNTAVFDFTVPYTLPPTLSNLVIPENMVDGQLYEIRVDVLGDQEIESVKIDMNGITQDMIQGGGDDYFLSFHAVTGVYPFAITATNASGLSARLPGTVTVYPALPDLAFDRILMSPDTLTNRDTAQFTMKVTNEGFAGAADVPVVIRMDGEDLRTDIVTLGAPEGLVFTLEWDAVPGLHTLELTADPENALSESDETNNIKTFSFRVSNVTPPVISEIKVQDTAFTRESIPVQADVTDERAITVRAEIGTESAVMELDEGNWYKGQLTAPSTDGDYVLRVIAENEDGLIATREIATRILDSRPDLSLSPADLRINPRRFVEDEPEIIEAEINNRGGTDVIGAAVELLVDGQSLGMTELSIWKGTNAVHDWEWIPTFGAHDLTFVLDPANQVAESNEENNVYTLSVYVDDIIAPGTPRPNAQMITQSEEWSDQHTWRFSWPPVEERNMKTYSYRVDGGPWVEIGLETYVDITFEQAGRHSFTVYAEDLAGNTSSAGGTEILLDFAAPDAPILYGDTNGRWVAENDRGLSWTAPADDGSGAIRYIIKIDGVESDAGNVNSFIQVWPDGTHRARVAAVDALDHQSPWSNEVALMIDTAAPSEAGNLRSSTHPLPDSWYANGTPAFTWNVSSDASGIWGYYYILDNNNGTVPDSRYLWTDQNSLTVPADEALSTGIWYLHVVPVDNTGKTGEAAHLKFQVDLSPPFTAISLIPNTNTILLSPSDDRVSVDSTRYRLNSGPWQTGTSFSLPSVGDHNVEYYSVDSLGNQEQTRQVTINLQKPSTPQIVATTPSDIWTNNTVQMLAWGEPLTLGSGLAEYRVRIDGTTVLSAGKEHTFIHAFSDGIHTMEVAAVDILDEQSDWSPPVTFRIDTTPPPAPLNLRSGTHSSSGTWYANGLPSFEWDAPEDLSGILGYEYRLDRLFASGGGGGTVTVLFSQFTENTFFNELSWLDSGIWSFRVAAIDVAGNTSEEEDFTFRVDLEAPATNVNSRDSSLVKLIPSDAHSGVQRTDFRIYRQNNTPGEWQTGTEVRITSDGDYQIEYYSVDHAGNQEDIKIMRYQYSGGSSYRCWKSTDPDEWCLPEPEDGEIIIQGGTIDEEEEEAEEEIEDDESTFFRKVRAYYSRLKNIISWNNDRPDAAYFAVYKSKCDPAEDDCQMDLFRKTRTKSPLRMRATDWAFGKSYYYQIVSYDRSGAVLEKSPVISPRNDRYAFR